MSPTTPPFPATGHLLLSASVGLALTLSAFSWLLATGATQAQQSPRLTQEQRTACTTDFKRLCPGQMPGGGRVKQCFADHYEELSPPCQAAVDASAAAN
jgi:hypothetical protein